MNKNNKNKDLAVKSVNAPIVNTVIEEVKSTKPVYKHYKKKKIVKPIIVDPVVIEETVKKINWFIRQWNSFIVWLNK
jgi:hypothetical protein